MYITKRPTGRQYEPTNRAIKSAYLLLWGVEVTVHQVRYVRYVQTIPDCKNAGTIPPKVTFIYRDIKEWDNG